MGVRAKPKTKTKIERSTSMKTRIMNPLPWLAVCVVSLAAALPSQALTPAEATGILYLRQEEKLARDVYQALATRWDIAAFRNIALAEQRHMDAVDALITRYGLQDPTPADAGKFSLPELQKLHDDLLARGQVSLTEALRVGVTVEETDIADLKEAIAVAVEAPVLRVFGNLLRASTQHLSAFTTLLTSADPSAVATVGAAGCPNGGSCAAASCGMGRQNRGMGNCGNGQGVCARDGSCPMGAAPGGRACTQTCPTGNQAGVQAGAGQPVTAPVRGRR